MNFNSTGNNFGAGAIAFKSYQEQNYVVLNAKFSFRTDSPEYLAADVLEIYVPDLSIERSAITGVMMRFIDRRTFSNRTYSYDGGTVLKSWIKDKNTLCIEKLTNFDDKGEVIIYIQALYTMLGRSGNPIRGTMTRLEFSQEAQYLRWNYDSLCVIFDHWVFLHMEFSSCSYAYRDLPWECNMDNFPKDVTADVPFPGGSNQFNPSVNGMSEAHIENGVFTCQERELGFESTGYDPFIFAYLVRDNE